MPFFFPAMQRDDSGVPVPEHPGDRLVGAKARETIRVMQVKPSTFSRHARSMPESGDFSAATSVTTGAPAGALGFLFSFIQEREDL
jgi:hypothetical protein